MGEDQNQDQHFNVHGKYDVNLDAFGNSIIARFDVEGHAKDMINMISGGASAYEINMTANDSLYLASVKKSTKCETCGSRVIAMELGLAPDSLRITKKAFFEFKRWHAGGLSSTEHTPMRCRKVKLGEEEAYYD